MYWALPRGSKASRRRRDSKAGTRGVLTVVHNQQRGPKSVKALAGRYQSCSVLGPLGYLRHVSLDFFGWNSLKEVVDGSSL